MKVVHAGLVYDRLNNAILLGRRRPDQLFPNTLEFPGGKSEGDETGFQTLKRELREELSIEIHSAVELITVEHPTLPDWSITFHLVERYSGFPTVDPNSHTEHLWLSPLQIRFRDDIISIQELWALEAAGL